MGGARVRRITSAVTVALVVAACTSSDESSAPASSTSSTIPAIPNPSSAEVLRQHRLYQHPDPLGPLALANGVPPALLAPGDHTTDVLGIEVTLHLDDWWRLDGEKPGSFTLNRPDAPLGGSPPAILFERPVGLASPARVADGNLLPGEYPVPPEQLGSWLDDVPQIEVLATGDAVAGDRTGRWYEIDVDPDAGPTLDSCSPGTCVHTWWSGASDTITARDLESLRYYEFPDPAGPVFVLVAAADDEYDEWVEVADRLIRTARFGPSAPHPVPVGLSIGEARAHEPGEEWRFVAFPGVVFTPETHRFSEVWVSVQWPGKLLFLPWGPSVNLFDAGIVRPLQDAAGDPLRSLDEVVEVLASTLTRQADETVFDTMAAVFSGVVDGPIFRRVAVEDGDRPDFAYWPDREIVHVWAFDSPIGPLLLAAETERESYLGLAKSQAFELVELLAFECPIDACGGETATTGSECATDSCGAFDESGG